ncbi:MAG TPA: beta-ketoacyl-[acyl-carrier-protein] synthase family protein [Phycisphaerales bacterium]|nr:beta-ketoacyl-[acyl-carrier-protein] synthase family protein [Phycisphaerales bacterium]HMP37782.1 beta-ketoacyl-[acyl-carrier-protein] synthase family protein [Phycisphaerales bacterium]
MPTSSSGSSTSRRIVITGMGWVTPLGHDLETVWSALMAGRSGVDRISRFEAETFPTNFAAEVRDFDFTRFVEDPRVHEGAGLNIRFALGAARQAWEQAGLSAAPADLDRRRIGIYLGAGEGVLDTPNYIASNLAGWEAADGTVDAVRWARTARARMRPVSEITQEPNMPLAHLAREFGLRGPAYNCLTACAASTQAIGEAFSILRRGDADAMLAGGTHTMIHLFGITGFNRLTALATAQALAGAAAGDPRRASRPFSRDRSGFVMGEGSGMVVLETLDHAERRGATPLAEVVGYGSSADAFRITDIQPEGRGAAAAMTMALRQAGIDPAAASDRPPIDYISAHGTGTQENDSIETRAVKLVFGDNARRIPMSSVKSMLGHLIAAAGAVELITCVLAIRRGMLPPTINLENPDPDLDLDYVPNAARAATVETCLSNSFGFGGQNDTLVVRRWG